MSVSDLSQIQTSAPNLVPLEDGTRSGRQDNCTGSSRNPEPQGLLSWQPSSHASLSPELTGGTKLAPISIESGDQDHGIRAAGERLPSSLERTFPGLRLAQAAKEEARVRIVLDECIRLIESKLARRSLTVSITTNLKGDPEEASWNRYIVRVRAPGLDLVSRIRLWDELALALDENRASIRQKLSQLPPPRAKALEILDNVMIHMDLS